MKHHLKAQKKVRNSTVRTAESSAPWNDRWYVQDEYSYGQAPSRYEENYRPRQYESDTTWQTTDYQGGRGQPSVRYRDDSEDFDDQTFGDYRSQGQRPPEKGYAGVGPKGYKRSDETIHSDVCECLTRSWEIDAAEIGVEVTDGEVTLTGTVPDRSMKRLAEDEIETISGVKEIHNRLRIAKKDRRAHSTKTETSEKDQRAA